MWAVTGGVRETQPVRILSGVRMALGLCAALTSNSGNLKLVVMLNGDPRFIEILGENFCP